MKNEKSADQDLQCTLTQEVRGFQCRHIIKNQRTMQIIFTVQTHIFVLNAHFSRANCIKAPIVSLYGKQESCRVVEAILEV